MRRDVLRLTYALGMSRRLVSEATGIGKTAVGEYVRRAAAAGLGWPIPDEIDDAELERRLFPLAEASPSASRTDPDWPSIHTEMKRRGVTLALLWHVEPSYPDAHRVSIRARAAEVDALSRLRQNVAGIEQASLVDQDRPVANV
jgi:transposase